MIKKTVTAIFFVFIFLLSNGDALAQNTFGCAYIGEGEQVCIVDVERGAGCPGGITDVEQDFCKKFNNSETECNDASGYCQSCDSPKVCQTGSSCGEGFVSASGTCADANAVCCVSEDTTLPPPDKCYECQVDLGRNFCTARVRPEGGETCDPYWEDENECNADCVRNPTYDSFTCDEDSNRCVPAESGRFTGEGAYYSCLQQCGKITFPHCKTPDGDSDGIPTALGCLSPELVEFIGQAVELSIGIGGAITLFMIVVSAFKYMTSTGNPDRLLEARETLFAAIGGLLLIILSGFIVRLLGVNIFGLF